MPVADLYRELWADDVPRSAPQTLQTYVLQLRKRIGSTHCAKTGRAADPKHVLITRPGGYFLNIGDGIVDIHDFERLAESGHRAAEAGDFLTASEHFRAALDVWRGDALVDVRTGPVLQAGAQRLREARLNALDRRIDADLHLGRHHEVTGELTELVDRHPTHEGLCAHLMVALHRCGRRDHAIHTYRRVRARLGSIGTSTKLDHLHDVIASAESGSTVDVPA